MALLSEIQHPQQACDGELLTRSTRDVPASSLTSYITVARVTLLTRTRLMSCGGMRVQSEALPLRFQRKHLVNRCRPAEVGCLQVAQECAPASSRTCRPSN